MLCKHCKGYSTNLFNYIADGSSGGGGAGGIIGGVVGGIIAVVVVIIIIVVLYWFCVYKKKGKVNGIVNAVCLVKTHGGINAARK